MQKKNKSLLILLLILNIIFIVYYSILVYYNRLAQDDFDFLCLVNQKGILGFVREIYMNHQGRFSTFVIQGIKYALINKTGSYAFVPIVNWLIYIFSLSYLLYHLLKSFSKKVLILLSVFLTNILLIINFEFSSFFWIASSEFVVVASPLLLFTTIFCNKKKSAYILLFLLSLLIGGWSEAFSPLILFFLFLAFFLLVFSKKMSVRDAFKNPEIQKIIFSFTIILIGFAFVVFAPGNANRMGEYEQPTSIIRFLELTVKNFAVFSYLFAFRMPYVLFAAFVFFVLGLNSKNTIKLGVKEFLVSSLIMAFVVWISTFPAAFAMSSFGFHRIYTPVIFWLLLFFCFWFYVLGANVHKEENKKNEKLLTYASYLATLFVCIIQIWNIKHDIPIAKTYSEADKARIELLLEEKQKGRTEGLYLEPLPSRETENFKSLSLSLIGRDDKKPVLYYSNEIDTDIVEGTFIGYSNKMLMQYYELPFAIYLKP